MSTASVTTLPHTTFHAISLWLQKSFNSVRAATNTTRAKTIHHSPSNLLQAEKLRGMARDMMRIDASAAADMFAAADRHEFGYHA